MTPSERRRQGGLIAAGIVSFLLLFHNYALPILPRVERTIAAADLRPAAAGAGFGYALPFAASEPDGPYATRSQTRIYENDLPIVGAHATADIVRDYGAGNWAHEPGRIVFSPPDNSDPRTNGRRYRVSYPILYHHLVGWAAALVFAASVWALSRPAAAAGAVVRPAAVSGPAWSWRFAAPFGLFLAGLYLSTGTLSPYGDTAIPVVSPITGYLYNPDHPHFRALFDFVDGRERSVWDGALFIRRILYNLIAYPAMKAFGWELGGTLTSLALNLAAFAIFVSVVSRQMGMRAGTFCAWALALYPGAAYWGGLPYQHALIVPSSLLLMLALRALDARPGWRVLLGASALLGLANLGYELFIFFLPASVLLLAWRRRWAAIPVSVALQVGPLVLWAVLLKRVFHQDLVNSSSTSFYVIFTSYLHIPDLARWRALLVAAPDVAADVFFGANFIFLPAAYLGLVGVNAATSRVRHEPAELCLLAAGLIFFLFSNLAPDYAAPWQMRGTWIARLYQPIFPAFLLFGARWYRELPPLARAARLGLAGAGSLLAAGSFLVIFGPALMNPLRLSETAFYRFYDHSNHANYEQNLRTYGRRPLGFPRAPAP